MILVRGAGEAPFRAVDFPQRPRQIINATMKIIGRTEEHDRTGDPPETFIVAERRAIERAFGGAITETAGASPGSTQPSLIRRSSSPRLAAPGMGAEPRNNVRATRRHAENRPRFGFSPSSLRGSASAPSTSFSMTVSQPPGR